MKVARKIFILLFIVIVFGKVYKINAETQNSPKKALYLCAFEDEFHTGKEVSFDLGVMKDEIFSEYYNTWRFDTVVNEDVTVDTFANLDDYNLIFIYTHGTYDEKEDKSYFFTREKVDKRKTSWHWMHKLFGFNDLCIKCKHIDEYEKGWIDIGTTSNGENFVVISPEYIKEHNKNFNQSVVVATACYSLRNDSMAKAFLDGGSSYYYGNSNMGAVATSDMICKAIAIEYLKGRTPLDIMDMLKEQKVNPNDESGRCKEGTLADYEYIGKSGELIANTFSVVKNELINDSKEDDNDLGNSIQNILSGGLVAYDDEYVYYNYDSIGLNDGNSGIYKRNLNTNEETKITDGTGYAMYINLYKDYVYYMSSYGIASKNEIVRVKKDGSEKEVIASLDDNIALDYMQIIDDNLYYSTYDSFESYSNAIQTNSEVITNLMKINLETLEKINIYTDTKLLSENGSLFVKSNGNIDVYLRENKELSRVYGKIIKNILNENNSIDIKSISIDNIKNIIGTTDNFIYYFTYTDDGSYNYKLTSESLIDGKVKEYKEIYKDNIAGFMLGDNNLYYVDYSSSALNAISLNDGERKFINNIDIRDFIAQRDEIAKKLFEVDGYLSYYNSNGQLIIDKSVILNKNNEGDTIVEEEVEEKIAFDGVSLDASGFSKIEVFEADLNEDGIMDFIELYGTPGETSFGTIEMKGEIAIVRDGNTNEVLTSFNCKNGMFLSGVISIIDINNDGIKDINLSTFHGGVGSGTSSIYLYDSGSYISADGYIYPQSKKLTYTLKDNFILKVGIENSETYTEIILNDDIKNYLIKEGYYEDGIVTQKAVNNSEFSTFRFYGYDTEDIDNDGYIEVVEEGQFDIGLALFRIDFKIISRYIEENTEVVDIIIQA